MSELLAPAGDMEKLKIALLYGADAVYIGGIDYSLRANAKNFTNEEIKMATLFTHSLNKKIYVTVNILFHEETLSGLKEYLMYLKSIAVDAVIVSDIVALTMAKECGLNVFLSTQASTLNYEAVNFWKKLGVKRIVLGREATKEDIITIKEKTGIELECFIHGAMCTSISGKCVLSNYVTNRDSNRGGCAQVCRFVFQTENGPEFTFMSKDLNMTEYLKSMLDIGIDSFKIEGRMRSIYYIATVVMCYRHLIDGLINNTLSENDIKYYEKVLARVANRDTAPQFYQKFPGVSESYFGDRLEASNQDFLGIVLDYDAYNKEVVLEERNHFEVGVVAEFIGPNIEPFTYKIKEIYDENQERIMSATRPKMIVRLPLNRKVPKFSMLRLKVFDKTEVL